MVQLYLSHDEIDHDHDQTEWNSEKYRIICEIWKNSHKKFKSNEKFICMRCTGSLGILARGEGQLGEVPVAGP